MTFFTRLFRPAPGPPPSDRAVRRNTQPFHEERGWTVRGGIAQGYYRTRFGSYAGRIDDIGTPHPEYFIIDPPRRLLDSPHGACFRQRSRSEFSIHWNRRPATIDQGILRVEHAILDAFA